MIWRAWAACGNSIPAAMVTTLRVRISRRPCAVSVLRWPGSTCAPGQPGKLATQSGLVALHGQHPVRTARVEVRDVLALGVQRVGGDHHVGQVCAGQGVQQGRERGDLARKHDRRPRRRAGVSDPRRSGLYARAGSGPLSWRLSRSRPGRPRWRRARAAVVAGDVRAGRGGCGSSPGRGPGRAPGG